MLLLIDHPYVTINRSSINTLSMLLVIVHPYATINRSIRVTINRSSLWYY